MDPFRQTSAAALCAAALFFAASNAPAQTASEGDPETPFTARGLIAPTFGQSLLADTPIKRTALRYELAGGAAIGEFQGELAFGFTHFLSERGDNINQVIVSDMLVGAAYDLAEIDVLTFRPRVDVILPASKYSQERTMWFASHVGFDAIINAGPMYLLGRARLRRDMHREAIPNVDMRPQTGYRSSDPGPYGFRNAGSRVAGREDPTPSSFVPPPGIVVLGLPNVAWGTHLGIDMEGLIPGGVFVDLGFSWTHTWSYGLADIPNVIRGPSQPERLQLNAHTGKVGVGWRSSTRVRFEARLGLSTTGRTRLVDDSGPRFPWYNFEDPSYDDSVLDLRLSARYR